MKYIDLLHQLPEELRRTFRHYESVCKKLNNLKWSITFNSTCLKEYIYMCVCVYVYMYIQHFLPTHNLHWGGVAPIPMEPSPQIEIANWPKERPCIWPYAQELQRC